MCEQGRLLGFSWGEGECMYVRAGEITGIQLGWKVSACMCEHGRLLGFSWGGR